MLSNLNLPWYHSFGILAAEMVLFYAVGLITGLILAFRNIRPVKCPKCDSAPALAGSYFNDKEKMNLDDLIFTIIYIGFNAGVWVYILIY